MKPGLHGVVRIVVHGSGHAAGAHRPGGKIRICKGQFGWPVEVAATTTTDVAVQPDPSSAATIHTVPPATMSAALSWVGVPPWR